MVFKQGKRNGGGVEAIVRAAVENGVRKATKTAVAQREDVTGPQPPPLPHVRQSYERRRRRRTVKILAISCGVGFFVVSCVAIILAALVTQIDDPGTFEEYDAATREIVRIKNKVYDLADNKNELSIKELARRLDSLTDNLEVIVDRFLALPELPLEEQRKLERKYRDQMRALDRREMESGFKFGFHCLVSPEFRSALNRFNSTIERLTEDNGSR